MFESVDARTDARTHGRTPARVPSYKLTLWAFGSGELINMNHNRSTALERSVKITGGFNRFYGISTSPSASVMAQNIQFSVRVKIF